MKLLFMLVIGIVGFTPFTESYKILAFHPTPSRSHVIIMKAILKRLAEKGHEVTLISGQPLDKPIKNFREVIAGEVDPDL